MAQEQTPTPAFVSVAIADLPKRLVRGRAFDDASAQALLAMVSVPGSGASDGILYTDTTGPDADTSMNRARKAASAARRLLTRVAPDAELVKSRVYPDAGGHRWAVSLLTEKPKARKAK